MNPEKAHAQSVNILESCIDEISVVLSVKTANQRTALETIRRNLNDYPDFEPSGKLQKVDRFTVMAISKIDFGLLGDLPPKIALEDAYRYMCESLSFLVDMK
jgi:hypothetical protein